MADLPLNAWRNPVWTAALIAAFVVAVAFLLTPAPALAQAWQDMDQLGSDVKTSYENWGISVILFIGIAMAVVMGWNNLGRGLGVLGLTVFCATMFALIA